MSSINNFDSINKLFQNYELVSLGHSCYPKMFIEKICSKETFFFDWIGSSTWAIIKLLESNFTHFFNITNYFYLNKIFKPCDRHFLIYNKQYFIKFIHDSNFLKNNNEWNNFKNKYTRRIHRFNNLLQSNKQILFFYLEENLFRYDVLYPEIKQFYPNNKEHYHIEQSKLEQSRMRQIVNIFKTKYNKHNFKIIYFSHLLEHDIHFNDNIIFIKTDSHYDNFDANTWAKHQCLKSILNNYDYIYDILANR